MSDINEVDIQYTTDTYGFTEELTEENFYLPAEAEYEDFGEAEEEHDAASLWENIRKKKEREGKNYKPAKKGDKDRPDPDAWKKAQSEPSDKQKGKSSYKYENPKTGEEFTYTRKGNYRKGDTALVFRGEAAEYQGKKVKLGKPFLTPDGPKKRSVYVKNGSGNVVKVNFGDPNMSIKKDNPARRKSFRARHNCANPGPKWKARYWSCKAW